MERDQQTRPMTIGYKWLETPVLGGDSAMNPRGPPSLLGQVFAGLGYENLGFIPSASNARFIGPAPAV
jgi:hypothetical protein